MNKEIRELISNMNEKKEVAKNLVSEGKIEEAKALTKEIKNLADEIEVKSALFEEEKEKIEMKNTNKEVQNLEVVAFKNAITGKPLTEEMKNAVVSTTEGGYLVPEQLIGEIKELRRQFVSLKDAVNVIPVQSAKGSIPIEDGANFSKMVDFDEINDLAVADIKFNNITFALKNKGALVPMSNTLLADEKAGLPAYVNQALAKKQVKTENADILAVLTAGAPKVFADLKAVKKSFNKDLDPGLKGDGFAFIMNSDAFGMLDDEVDAQSRPVLQPNPTQATGKLLFGFPVIVLSNTELPTVSGKAPIVFGNMQNAVIVFDRNQLEIASSTEAGFVKNQTILRAITRYDVKGQDSSAFVYGQLDVSTYLA